MSVDYWRQMSTPDLFAEALRIGWDRRMDDDAEEEIRRRSPVLGVAHRAVLAVAEANAAAYEAAHPEDWMLREISATPSGRAADAWYLAVRRTVLGHPVDGGYYDTAALAARLGVQPGTVRTMQHRGTIPGPDITVGGAPAWWCGTVEEIERTRRPPGRPRAEVLGVDAP